MLFKINFQNRTMSCDFPRLYALPFSPLSPTLSPSFNTSFSVFHLNNENGQIIHVWNQMVKICSRLGWHASSPIDNAANSADTAAELSWPQQWALRYTQNGIAAHHLPSPPKIKRTRTCWTVQTRVDVSYTECRGSILFVSWPRITCNMFLWPRLCLNAF